MSYNWFLDFDDTLVTGSTTWALEFAVPQFIQDYKLSFQPDIFQDAALEAQEQVTNGESIDTVTISLFKKLGWPSALHEQLLNNIMSAYRPTVFEDSFPFLNRLRTAGHSVYVISNNVRAPEIAASLKLKPYFDAFFTPNLFPGTKPKPHRSLWDSVLETVGRFDPQHAVIVGDDPWSDGAFAEVCGLKCWIVDRRGSFTQLYDKKPYRWVRSLAEIEV